MRVAFYAPLKPPDHPVPSGDRQMARLLMAALEAGGHEVAIASRLRSFVPRPDYDLQAAVEARADAEVAAIARQWECDGSKPDLWFTYHPYYKAPDFLGSRLSRTFGLPYAAAEASHAPKRQNGPWARWHGASTESILMAAVHFCFTDVDRSGLERLGLAGRDLVALPPFIDVPSLGAAMRNNPGPVEIVTVAMMRAGAKSRSYAFLAEALARLRPEPAWRLTIIGDGPARDAVRTLFAALPADRVHWRGELPSGEIAAALASVDVFAWPGFEEAYGLCYLEAGAAALPVIAMDSGGVASVVRHGETGILTPEGDLEAYVGALASVVEDADLRGRLGAGGRRFVSTERTLARAGAILGAGLQAVLSRNSRGPEVPE